MMGENGGFGEKGQKSIQQIRYKNGITPQKHGITAD
jgi:hypothetical protein